MFLRAFATVSQRHEVNSEISSQECGRNKFLVRFHYAHVGVFLRAFATVSLRHENNSEVLSRSVAAIDSWKGFHYAHVGTA